MIEAEDVGGVHVKYLYHCHRQLWLYARGVRPEHLNATVQLGEAVHETSYTRSSPVDLGAAKLDHLDGAAWVHEVKSSGKPSRADEAQVMHYCYRLRAIGVDAQGGILHYPKTRRTSRLPYTGQAERQAEADIDAVLTVVRAPVSPPRPARTACRGCSYLDYCWND
ncbi:CRISPR-associated exonuclease Cas4 [Thermocatellispora tengchongensis]|uniref:CRISPR-associated exonuclease Cas4 n=1 Tax=Thermocatellispora tengchongensis TaxID=1073253 RepID=A0A840PFG5_9ACTN|nr:CRISPR-associated protein Cas4 [Thermocatellispora tengchongensis]MBB5136200.1 CRISPR-associated exonuclease Cas4 [Thermocatellispora tengchongensis]